MFKSATSKEKRVLITALQIGLVVGTLLNFINQGEVLLAGEWEKVNWFKCLLTYSVPFMVSAYSSLRAMQGK